MKSMLHKKYTNHKIKRTDLKTKIMWRKNALLKLIFDDKNQTGNSTVNLLNRKNINKRTLKS